MYICENAIFIVFTICLLLSRPQFKNENSGERLSMTQIAVISVKDIHTSVLALSPFADLGE